MGKSAGRKVIEIFANSQKDVRYRLKRAQKLGVYKDYIIKKIKQSGKDAIGHKRYVVTLHKRRGR